MLDYWGDFLRTKIYKSIKKTSKSHFALHFILLLSRRNNLDKEISLVKKSQRLIMKEGPNNI